MKYLIDGNRLQMIDGPRHPHRLGAGIEGRQHHLFCI
jgi:hypothetical protein